MMNTEYVYRVIKAERALDGDTMWLRLDVGFRQEMLCEIRLLGYDCPERHGRPTYELDAAREAWAFTVQWLADHWADTWVRTEKDPDNFGRWLGSVMTSEGDLLGEALKKKGLASVWPTRWREEHPPPA